MNVSFVSDCKQLSVTQPSICHEWSPRTKSDERARRDRKIHNRSDVMSSDRQAETRREEVKGREGGRAQGEGQKKRVKEWAEWAWCLLTGLLCLGGASSTPGMTFQCGAKTHFVLIIACVHNRNRPQVKRCQTHWLFSKAFQECGKRTDISEASPALFSLSEEICSCRKECAVVKGHWFSGIKGDASEGELSLSHLSSSSQTFPVSRQEKRLWSL